MSSENYEENGYGLDLDLLIISYDIMGIFDIWGVGIELKCPFIGPIFFVAFYTPYLSDVNLRIVLWGDIGRDAIIDGGWRKLKPVLCIIVNIREWWKVMGRSNTGRRKQVW